MNNPIEASRVVEIIGEHGLIRLVIPHRKPTPEELTALHTIIAETILNSEKEELKPPKEAAN